MRTERGWGLHVISKAPCRTTGGKKNKKPTCQVKEGGSAVRSLSSLFNLHKGGTGATRLRATLLVMSSPTHLPWGCLLPPGSCAGTREA